MSHVSDYLVYNVSDVENDLFYTGRVIQVLLAILWFILSAVGCQEESKMPKPVRAKTFF